MQTTSLISDKFIPINKNGKTFWLTQEQYDQLLSGVAELDCVTGECKIHEKKFHVPDFLRGKQIINETACLT